MYTHVRKRKYSNISFYKVLLYIKLVFSWIKLRLQCVVGFAKDKCMNVASARIQVAIVTQRSAMVTLIIVQCLKKFGIEMFMQVFFS